MRIVLPPKAPSDVKAIRDSDRAVAGPALADGFYRELRRFIVRAARQPGSFAVCEHDLRRANLDRFPYHYLFRVTGDVLRVLVVRHHRQRPSYGARRR